MLWKTSSALALIFFSVYLCQSLRHGRQFEVRELITICFNAAGIAGGGLAAATVVFPIQVGPGPNFYVILGGLAILGTCAKNAYTYLWEWDQLEDPSGS